MKFSIRDLLLVTVIVALAVGWWVDRSRLKTELQKGAIERLRAHLERDVVRGPRTMTIPIEDRDKAFQKVIDLTNKLNSQPQAPNPPKE